MNEPFLVICIVFLCLANYLEAQSSDVGYQSLELYDANRNRLVPVEIYYPLDNDNNISGGDFSVLVFGHGFLMEWTAYENFWTSLVPEGYVLCFPRTEMSLTPSHQDFGEDIKFIAGMAKVSLKSVAVMDCISVPFQYTGKVTPVSVVGVTVLSVCVILW